MKRFLRIITLVGFAISEPLLFYGADIREVDLADSLVVTAPRPVHTAPPIPVSATSVPEALQTTTGLQIRDYGGVGGVKTINIRSMGSQHVGVFYDGLAIGNAQNGQVDLGKVSLDELESVEVIRGASRGLFLSAREQQSAYALYLQTKRIYFADSERIHLRANVCIGTSALVKPTLHIAVKVKEGATLSADGQYQYANGHYSFRMYDSSAVRHNGDVSGGQAGLQWQHYYSASGVYTLRGSYYDTHRGIPGAIVNNVWSNGERMVEREGFVQGAWKDHFGRVQVGVKAKYAYDYTHYWNTDPRQWPVDKVFEQHETYASVYAVVQCNPHWQVATAYDIIYNHLDTLNRITHLASVAVGMHYGPVEVQLTGLLTALKNTHKCSPIATITYTPLDQLTITALYKQTYRLPTFNDLYYTDVGNCFLRPETARQTSLEMDYETHGWSLKGAYYFNTVSDKIIAYPRGQMFRWTMLNLGRVQVHGVELSVNYQYRWSTGWHIAPSINYTFQRAIDVTSRNDSYYHHQIPYIPKHAFNGACEIGYKDYVVQYSCMYTGARYDGQQNIRPNYMGAWFTQDIALKATYGRWQWQLVLQNLAGQQYQLIRNYPMPKRVFRGVVSYDL